MTTLDSFFQTEAEIPAHPRLRTWKKALAEPGVTAQLELLLPAPALGLGHVEMLLSFNRNGQALEPESMAWNDDLNAGLIKLGVRAVDAAQEAERFALGFRAAFHNAAIEYGDGQVNVALVDLISDSDLLSYPELADVLRHCAMPQPSRASKADDACRQMLADAIAARAHELTHGLGYRQEEAKPILLQALSRYMDRRFSVSRRRGLGLL